MIRGSIGRAFAVSPTDKLRAPGSFKLRNFLSLAIRDSLNFPEPSINDFDPLCRLKLMILNQLVGQNHRNYPTSYSNRLKYDRSPFVERQDTGLKMLRTETLSQKFAIVIKNDRHIRFDQTRKYQSALLMEQTHESL